MEPTDSPRVNVADRLAAAAAERPEAAAVVAYDGRSRQDGCQTKRVASGPIPTFSAASFRYLDAEADVLARGMAAMGIGPGKRIALLVKPGIEFVTLVFALLRTGATMVLVDAGLGRKNLVRCLASTEPDGFVAIPLGHAVRVLKRRHFSEAKLNVTVGRRWFWGGETLESVRRLGEQAVSPSPTGGGDRGGGTRSGQGDSTCDVTPSPSPSPSLRGRGTTSGLPHTGADDTAAIVFTSGSTGPPKGVVYTHETFVTQCDTIQRQYDLRPGAVDLACFPLFGLFNVACGITTVLPEMDFSRPASCDPRKLIAAANHCKVTQAFASPAVWDRVSRHCEATGDSIPTLKKVLSCGAPVPANVMRRTLKCVHPEAEMHTPYGATEALPIATIEAREVLEETAAKTNQGAGVCVGRKFLADRTGDGEDWFDWRIIRITDDPIATIDETEELPTGEIGELIVRGPQVSTRYLTGEPSVSAGGGQHNAAAKITDGDTTWHRMGDVGYFDDMGRFWYCGRKSQRVEARDGTLYTECVEAQVNAHAFVNRSALVGVGDIGRQQPFVVFEPDPAAYERIERNQVDIFDLCDRVETHTKSVIAPHSLAGIEVPPQLLPTDIRHNSKIRREELAVWAEKQLRKRGG